MAELRQNTAPPAPGPEWQQLIDDYLPTLVAAGQPATTLNLRRTQLEKTARQVGGTPAELTADRLVAWLGAQDWATETRRSYRGALRGFLRWAYRTKRIPNHLADELPAVREHRGAPRPTPDPVWRGALIAADPHVRLMLRLAAEAGLRRGEVSRVHTRDLIDSIDGPQLLVHGKGGKQRIVPISDSLADAIRGQAPAGGWLFPNDDNSSHLSAPWIGTLVSDVLPPDWTMHQLRHRFASRAYRGTRKLRAVQILLGHESVNTTSGTPRSMMASCGPR